jgi:cytidine deaminase
MIGSGKEDETDAAKKSARSAYCQYSRFGIGSRREAGKDSRLTGRNDGGRARNVVKGGG